jgi:nitroimidazol reductase NimA-like FMN-containing flavoprotein (pyridoxamine 5'-phosphate oxidase superfamily)
MVLGGKMEDLPREIQVKLEGSQNIWIASVRMQGRPHLVPVWFVWHSRRIYICIDPNSVKANNLKQNPYVALALEDGSKPVICEGKAVVVTSSWTTNVVDGFKKKYDWDITGDSQYTQLVEITPRKWLVW